MKSLDGPFVLAPDAVALAVAEIPATLRRGLAYDPDAVIWSRTRARVSPLIIETESALLLGTFRRPHTIPEGVVHYARITGCDPGEVMVASYPLFREVVERGLLLPESEWLKTRVEPVLQSGDRVGRWQVVSPIQVMEDGEVHRVTDGRRRPAALKLAGNAAGAARLTHEARVVAQLEDAVVPRLLEQGRFGDHDFLVLEWRNGQHPDIIAESLRAVGPAGRAALRRLTLAILDAYAVLHRRQVLHGDVHPRNLLVGPTGRVSILDLGYAVAPGIDPPEGRGGVASYLEPEAAARWREGRGGPPPTRAGEQYAVAALLYELITGFSYADFQLETSRFLDQVVRETPRPFSALKLPPWPDMERALFRALAKAPADRFPSVRALADQIRQMPTVPARPRRPPGEQGRWLEGELARLAQAEAAGGRARLHGSRISVYEGGAGAALALLRVACRRDDATLLAAADARCAWAEYRSGAPIGSERDHQASALLHSSAGVALTRAAIARARVDEAELSRAIRWLAALARGPLSSVELSSGMAGLLLGASRLLALPELGPGDSRALRGVQRRIAARLLRECRRAGGPAETRHWANLGLAHGWGGVLHALLACQESRTGRPPAELARWLDELDSLAVADGRARRWPWLERRDGRLLRNGSMTGWCNGSAGFVLLYLAAHRVLGRQVDLARAHAAAWDVSTRPAGSFDLCCGATGGAYALLAMARATGERRWVTRARALADYAFHHRDAAPKEALQSGNLFRGQAGLMLLLAELDDPGTATFPLIESLP
jgi:serine/threonine-protein kinase